MTIPATFDKSRGCLFVLACAVVPLGCGATARLHFSAADAIDALTEQTRLAVEEYQADLARADDAREAAVVAAFTQRARRDAADEPRVESHAADFADALARIRNDRAVAWRRYAAAAENLTALRHAAADLRSLAQQSSSLQDDWRRYVTNWWNRASSPSPPAATGLSLP